MHSAPPQHAQPSARHPKPLVRGPRAVPGYVPPTRRWLCADSPPLRPPRCSSPPSALEHPPQGEVCGAGAPWKGGLVGLTDQGAAGPVSARPARPQGWFGRGRDEAIRQGHLIHPRPASHAHHAQTPRWLLGHSSQPPRLQPLAQKVWSQAGPRHHAAPRATKLEVNEVSRCFKLQTHQEVMCPWTPPSRAAEWPAPQGLVPHGEHHVGAANEETCWVFSPSCRPGEMIHHHSALVEMQERRKAATGTFLLIRKVGTFLIKGSLKIISFRYLHMLKRLQRSRCNEVKEERTINAWLGCSGEWHLSPVGLEEG